MYDGASYADFLKREEIHPLIFVLISFSVFQFFIFFYFTKIKLSFY
jgi:hypothetical protein